MSNFWGADHEREPGGLPGKPVAARGLVSGRGPRAQRSGRDGAKRKVCRETRPRTSGDARERPATPANVWRHPRTSGDTRERPATPANGGRHSRTSGDTRERRALNGNQPIPRGTRSRRTAPLPPRKKEGACQRNPFKSVIRRAKGPDHGVLPPATEKKKELANANSFQSVIPACGWISPPQAGASLSCSG